MNDAGAPSSLRRSVASSLAPNAPVADSFRRDLELDALAEVLRGDRLIHGHS